MKNPFKTAHRVVAVMAMVGAAYGAAASAAPLTFLPEVLLLRSRDKGQTSSFTHAELSPAVTTDGREKTAQFHYKAAGVKVDCTITADGPDANGNVAVTVSVLRTRTNAQGGSDIVTRTANFTFGPGQSRIVDRDTRPAPVKQDGTVELLQLTLQK